MSNADKTAEKKVLFLSITAGQGHNSASKAVADYLTGFGITTKILDTYKYLNTMIGKSYDKGYQLYARYHPETLEKISQKNEKVKGTAQMKRYFPFVFADLTKNKMSKYIERFAPDVIICPHVLTCIMITQLRHDGLIDPSIPCIGIVTDYTLHAFWEYTDMDWFVVGADFMIEDFVSRGVSAEHVLPFGIPIREKFNNTGDKQAARNELGLKDMYTILTVAGGMGFGNLPEVVEDLSKLSDDYQIVVICGSNKRLLDKLSGNTYKNQNMSFIGFTDRIDEYMDAADVVYTKPGGLSTTEALTKDKMLLLQKPLPGVEEANVAYFTNTAQALCTNQYFTGRMVIEFLMKDNQVRTQEMETARSFYVKHHSAKRLGDFVLDLINNGGNSDAGKIEQ